MKDFFLVTFLFLAGILSIGYTYYHTIILQDFEVIPLEEEFEETTEEAPPQEELLEAEEL